MNGCGIRRTARQIRSLSSGGKDRNGEGLGRGFDRVGVGFGFGPAGEGVDLHRYVKVVDKSLE